MIPFFVAVGIIFFLGLILTLTIFFGRNSTTDCSITRTKNPEDEAYCEACSTFVTGECQILYRK